MSEKPVVEVYRARNGSQAQLFVMALEDAGIAAEVQGITHHPETAAADNLLIEPGLWWDSPRILVPEEDLERAQAVLVEFEKREARKTAEAKSGQPIEVACEECGSQTKFPTELRGSVQQCPECLAYLDVGEEELPEGWEEGGEEGESENEEVE